MKQCDDEEKHKSPILMQPGRHLTLYARLTERRSCFPRMMKKKCADKHRRAVVSAAYAEMPDGFLTHVEFPSNYQSLIIERE